MKYLLKRAIKLYVNIKLVLPRNQSKQNKTEIKHFGKIRRLLTCIYRYRELRKHVDFRKIIYRLLKTGYIIMISMNIILSINFSVGRKIFSF